MLIRLARNNTVYTFTRRICYLRRMSDDMQTRGRSPERNLLSCSMIPLQISSNSRTRSNAPLLCHMFRSHPAWSLSDPLSAASPQLRRRSRLKVRLISRARSIPTRLKNSILVIDQRLLRLPRTNIAVLTLFLQNSLFGGLEVHGFCSKRPSVYIIAHNHDIQRL